MHIHLLSTRGVSAGQNIGYRWTPSDKRVGGMAPQEKRPLRAHVERAFDDLFVVDATMAKPVLHKDQVYNMLRDWEKAHEPDSWTWTLLPIDPVRDIIADRVPRKLHDSICARLQVGYTPKREAGRVIQKKKRAHRYLRLRDTPPDAPSTHDGSSLDEPCLESLRNEREFFFQ